MLSNGDSMANFELWDRDTLNQFSAEATHKLLENDAEIERLRQLLAAVREQCARICRACEGPTSYARAGDAIAAIDAAMAQTHNAEVRGCPHNEQEQER